jgi:hypothetical protein
MPKHKKSHKLSAAKAPKLLHDKSVRGEWLASSIGYIYLRAGMYARNRYDLYCQLEWLHRVWAYVMDRVDAFHREHKGLHEPITNNSELDVVEYWRALDRRIGLTTADE